MNETIEHPRQSAGIAMAAGAIALWSCSSACAVWVGKQVGAWQFMFVSCAMGGAAQMAFYLYRGHSLRSLLLPPPRLLALILLTFVSYMIFFVEGLVLAANPAQAAGVSLTNYLWPTLTVFFAVLLVPGTRMTIRLGAAMAMSLAGLLVANWTVLFDPSAGVSVAPYLLVLAAAILWSVYCAFIARWRDWANRYATAPLGFLLVAAIAAVVCWDSGRWTPMDGATWVAICFAGLGVQGAAYLLWELGLHRAPASVMGLMAASLPVLSTVALLGMYAVSPQLQTGTATNYTTLMIAAAMIASAVLIGAYKSNGKKPAATSVDHDAARRDSETPLP